MENLRVAFRCVSNLPQVIIRSGMLNPIVKIVACVALATFAAIALKYCGMHLYRSFDAKKQSLKDRDTLKDRENLKEFVNRIPQNDGEREAMRNAFSRLQKAHGVAGLANMINGKDRYGRQKNAPLLHEAVITGNHAGIAQLIRHGADRNALGPYTPLETVLKDPAVKKRFERVRSLVQNYSVDVNGGEGGALRRPPIIYFILHDCYVQSNLAEKQELLKIIKYLIEKNASVQILNQQNYTNSLLFDVAQYWEDDPKLVAEILTSMRKRGAELGQVQPHYLSGLHEDARQHLGIVL